MPFASAQDAALDRLFSLSRRGRRRRVKLVEKRGCAHGCAAIAETVGANRLFQQRNERSPVVVGTDNGDAVKIAPAGIAVKGRAARRFLRILGAEPGDPSLRLWQRWTAW